MEPLSCTPNLMSKRYPNGMGERSWLTGRKQVDISCEYQCTTPAGDTEKVRGAHTVNYWFESNDTLSCKGAHYPADKWIAHRAEWQPQAPVPRSFDPAKSGIQALTQWATRQKK